nr:hypothetical protein [Tanacetum cinerariifolium]
AGAAPYQLRRAVGPSVPAVGAPAGHLGPLGGPGAASHWPRPSACPIPARPAGCLRAGWPRRHRRQATFPASP